MTPPQLLGLPRESQEGDRRIPTPTPSPSQTAPSVGVATFQSQRTESTVYMLQGAQTLQQLHPDRNVEDPRAYLQTVQEALSAADGNHMGNYKNSLTLLANLSPQIEDPQGQETIRATAIQAANDALDHIQSGGDLRWAPGQAPMTLREKSRFLFDLAMALGFILHGQGPDPLEAEHNPVLLRVYDQAFQLFEQNNADRTQGEAPRPLPDYFGSYLRAQRAMLNNEDEPAFRALVETRRIIQEINVSQPNYRAGGIRDQIRYGTDVALWQLGRDTSAQDAQNVRTRFSLTALSYFYANAQINEESSEESSDEARQTQIMQRVQQFNLVASIFLNNGLAGADAQTFLEHFHELTSEQVAPVQQIFQNQVSKNEALQNALVAMGFEIDSLGTAWPQLFENAQTVARHLWEQREETPYQGILQQDHENRPFDEAGNFLDQNEELRLQIAQVLGVSGPLVSQLQGRQLTEMLVSYGERLPILLEQSLSEEIRNGEAYQGFSEPLLQAAQGLRDNGLQTNVERPLRNLLNHLRTLVGEHDEYEVPVASFLQELAQTEHIMEGVPLPASIRNESRRAAEDLTGFSIWRVFERSFTLENIGMMAAGSLVAELGSMFLLGRAGTAGNLGRGLLVNGGRIRPLGHLAVGFMVAGSMSISGSLVHSLRNDNYDFWTTDNWSRIATGTAFATFAMGATMGFGHFLRGRMNIPVGQAPNIFQRLGMHVGTVSAGTVTMMGAGMANHRVHEGQWHIPTGEEWGEMAMTMWMWDRMSSWVWRPILSRTMPRRMVGPYHMENTVTPRVRDILARNPALAARESFLNEHLASLFARGQFGTVMEGLEGEHYPVVEGEGRSRRLEWRSQEQFIAQQGEALFESKGFTRGIRQVIREARHLIENIPERYREQAPDRAYILAERDGENSVEFHDPTLRPEGQEHMRFVVDRHGNIMETEGIRDNVLRNALERVQNQRIQSAAVSNLASTEVFRSTQLIAGNPNHPLHRAIIRALSAARRAVQRATQGGETNPEVYLRLRRQENRLDFELVENPAESERGGLLRVRERGYSNEDARSATGEDRLLGLLLESIVETVFPDSVQLPAPAGAGEGGRADPEEATAAQRSVPRPPSRRPARRTAPTGEENPIAATDPAEVARQLQSRYPEITRSQVEEAVSLMRAKNFHRGLVEILMELSTTTGSVATHPTVRVYQTEGGDFHFMIEGAEPPAGVEWGSFRVARGNIIDVQSFDPIFRILLQEGRILGPALLAMAGRQLPEPTPEPEAVTEENVESEASGDPDGTGNGAIVVPADSLELPGGADTTARRRPTPSLIQQSQRSRRPRGEPTRSMSAEEMARHRSDSRVIEDIETPPAEDNSEESFADVELVELEEVSPPPTPSRPSPPPPPLPSRSRAPTPPPPPLPSVPRESQRATFRPSDRQAGATEAEDVAIPLTRIRRRIEGIMTEHTQVMDTQAVQELMGLVAQIERRPFTQTRGEAEVQQDLAIIYDSEGSPMFEIVSPRLVERMAANDTDSPSHFLVTRHLTWNESTGEYQQQRVVFRRGIGLGRRIAEILRALFAD